MTVYISNIYERVVCMHYFLKRKLLHFDNWLINFTMMLLTIEIL